MSNPYTRVCRGPCGDERPLGRFRGTDRICRDCRAAQGRRRRAQPAAKRAARDRRYRRLYGITLAQYEQMGREQGWRCLVCARPPYPEGSRLVPDHNHESGEVRGLLCSPCNSGLGLFGEKPERLMAAARYLVERGTYPNRNM